MTLFEPGQDDKKGKPLLDVHVLSDTPPTTPIEVAADTQDGFDEDGLDRTPVFSWLSSLDLESDGLTYEINIYDSITSNLIGTANISGADIPASVLSEMRSWGLSSASTLSALSSMSAYVISSWLSELQDGKYLVKVRASDGTNYSPWSSDTFFFIDSFVDPASLVLVPKHGKVDIFWVNPPDADFAKTVIAFSIVDYPDPALGGGYLESVIVEDVDTPGSAGNFIHGNLINGVRYYYTAISYDEAGHITLVKKAAVPLPASSIKNLRATARDTAIVLTWENPTYEEFPNFQYVIIRAKTTGYPSDTNDGDLVYSGNSYYAIHEQLTNGQMYYYTAWTVDAYNEVILPPVTVIGVPIDLTAPTGNLMINNGAAITYSSLVELTVVGIDYGSGVTEMMLSNYSDFRDASFETYVHKKEWILIGSEGVQHVYLKLKDAAGNISQVIVASIDFRYDWINKINTTRSAIKGTTTMARYGVGIIAKSYSGIGLWADGNDGDLLLYRRRINSSSSNSGSIVVDGYTLSKYKLYAP